MNFQVVKNSGKAGKPVMSREQCDAIYTDMIGAYYTLAPAAPADERERLYQRLVGMLCALRIIRGDALEADLLSDIVEADIRAHERGLAPALNVRWL